MITPGFPPPLGAASTKSNRSAVEYLTHLPSRRNRGPLFCFRHVRKVSTLIFRYEAARRSLQKLVFESWPRCSVVSSGADIHHDIAREYRQLKYPEV